MQLSMTLKTLLRAASVLALIQQVSGACYRPNGVDRNANTTPDNYQACSKGGGHSMCCSTKSFDTCRDNGLCWNEGAKILWREACTDPTWRDPACLKLCVGADQLSRSPPSYHKHNTIECKDLWELRLDPATAEDGKSLATVDTVITICADNSLCCGSGDFAQRCCDAKKGYRILANRTVVEAYPAPKPITTPNAPKVTTTQRNTAGPTPQPANPAPNTGNGGGGGSTGGSGGGSNGDGGSTGGSGGGSTGDDNGASNTGSGGSGSGGNDSSSGDSGNNGGSGGNESGDTSDKPDSTTDPTSGDEDGTGDGKSSSTPKDSQNDDDSENQSGSDGPLVGKGNGNQDSKDSASSTDGNGNDAGAETSSGGSNKNGLGTSDGNNGNNDNGNSGTEPAGGNGNNGALIGGVVGGVLGGLILFAIAAWYVVRQRRTISALRLASASELPGTAGKTYYEVPGDNPVSKQQVVEQVVYTQVKVTEPSPSYEMPARSPVLAVPTRYS
ncbi:hypothetical protein V8F20_009379 [Naviculisporaceae sp. PSN 640]